MLTRDKIYRDYTKIKDLALRFSRQSQIEESLVCVETACKIANYTNFILSDYDIEDMLTKISSDILGVYDRPSCSERFIFYDCFGCDNRGLTQQYIRAMMSWGAEFLFILEDDADIRVSQGIVSELKAYDKAEIFIVSSRLSRLEKIKVLFEKIKSYNPSKAFLHLTPWDVVGIVLWNAFPFVSRYQINLTDHAFWIGIHCFDYILEFRDYGYNLSLRHRKIPPNRLLMAPYYPIISNHRYLGLPDEEQNRDRVKLFSGGNFYKVYGENGIYFDMLLRVLEENPSTVFYYAGGGLRGPFEHFIREYQLERRVYLLGDRPDISDVFRHIDIYLGTYPLCGGLMSQYAGVFSKPIVSYTNAKYQCNYIENLFPKLPEGEILTYTNLDEYFQEIRKLVQDKSYRQIRGERLHQAGISPAEFNASLKNVILSSSFETRVPEYDIDVDSFSDLYIDNENHFMHSYHRAFNGAEILKILLFRKLLLFIWVIINLFRYSNKSRYLGSILKKLRRIVT